MTIRVLIEKVCPECNGVGVVVPLAWQAYINRCIMNEHYCGPMPEGSDEVKCPTCKGQRTVPERMPLAEFKRLLQEVKP
jgi:DnaJ-class molecular chaperone